MKTLEVVCAIIKKEDKIFACERGYGEYKGFFEFPGGKVEPGESNEAAIIREIKEELDSDIEIESYLGVVNHDYPNYSIRMHAYVAKLVKGELTLLEHSDSKWLRVEEMTNYKFAPADLLIINNLLNKK